MSFIIYDDFVDVPRGVPTWLYILGFISFIVEYKVFILYSKSILLADPAFVEFLYRSTSIMVGPVAIRRAYPRHTPQGPMYEDV
jgi:hypothetical protein